jgi:hypothetical protein
MPFKYKPKGEAQERWYFEACEFIGNGHIQHEHNANHIALCPNCAAEYRTFADNISESERIRRVLALDATGDEANMVIELMLFVPRSLRFTQNHLIHLQAALREDCQNPE